MEGVTEIKGKQPGKSVAIFGGVHGNERIGIEVLRRLVEELSPDAGVVYLVEGNPPAIEAGIRQLGKNLNRAFIKGNEGGEPEDVRARELMQLLDTCDALLDIHASNSKKSVPFIVCEQEAFDLARLLPFSIVSSGWDEIEPGASDGYMHQLGKPALCLECGYAEDFDAHTALALCAVDTFLRYFGIKSGAAESATKEQQRIQVYKAVLKKTKNLSFAKEYGDFEALEEGVVFAQDGSESYVADRGDCIIFPRKDGALGSEAFILGKRLI